MPLDLDPIRRRNDERKARHADDWISGGDSESTEADIDALLAEVERLREFEWMYRELSR